MRAWPGVGVLSFFRCQAQRRQTPTLPSPPPLHSHPPTQPLTNGPLRRCQRRNRPHIRFRPIPLLPLLLHHRQRRALHLLPLPPTRRPCRPRAQHRQEARHHRHPLRPRPHPLHRPARRPQQPVNGRHPLLPPPRLPLLGREAFLPDHAQAAGTAAAGGDGLALALALLVVGAAGLWWWWGGGVVVVIMVWWVLLYI